MFIVLKFVFNNLTINISLDWKMLLLVRELFVTTKNIDWFDEKSRENHTFGRCILYVAHSSRSYLDVGL
jgi:hypothetical protein